MESLIVQASSSVIFLPLLKYVFTWLNAAPQIVSACE